MATPPAANSNPQKEYQKDNGNAEVETAVPEFLAPPVLNKIRNEDVVARIRMERSVSQEIRDEKADLREAAEKSTTVILDLSLEGNVRWVSPSWKDVIGTDPLTVVGKPVASLMLDEGPIFENAAESMKLDDSKSQTVRCKIRLGKDSVFNKRQKDASLVEEMESLDLDENGEDTILTLEGQGFMAHDRLTGGESHVMWMLRPFLGPREITIDLPELIVDTLGFGAEVLAQYLTSLVETNEDANATEQDKTLKMPPPILCRICECQIQPWWFEKHSELCMQEHQADLEVQMTHETLTDQRASIVKVLDNLEEHRAGAATPRDGSPTVAQAEYKGLPIGPKPTSPAHSTTRHGSRRNSLTSESRSHGNHSRVRSFAVRRPLARIVELILDLCDTAIEIKNPAVQNTPQNADDEVRTQSPGSESRISQVLQWQTPGSGTLDDEEGLAALVLDTENLARAKVEAVLRMQRILEYSEHIRVESQLLVEECIAAAMQKAEKIKEGNLSSSDSETTSATSDTEGEDTAETPGAHSALDSMDGLSAMASVFRTSHSPALSPHASRRQSLAMSTGSNSPLEASTPRSYSVASASLINKSAYPSKRASMFGGSDAGGESDASLASSVSVAPRNNSPGADISLARARSIRDRKRKSLKLPGIGSPHRQPSPGRSTGPSSPLRVNKSRQAPPSAIDQHPLSPLTSPVMQPAPSPSDHRRQSSIFTSDIPKMPGSPRLGPVNQPQPRPAPPSIKDFDIVKAISKGAFGSVYLAKKKATGDYYAIKVLKKADMVAKNQVTNVKAERAIMMWQGESDFVAKLYWTFSSKDYLYLVMEYLNGGDCASLIKVLGGLPEDWAKKYLAEVILGVEHLHSRGVVHRDLKPDNLLIDAKGHLKLTDFGLSRMGLIGRQKRMLNSPPPAQNPDLMGQASQARPLSMASSRSASFDFQSTHLSSVAPTPNTTPEILGPGGQHSYFSLARENSNGKNSPRRVSDQRSDSNGSDFLNMMFKGLTMEDMGKDKDKKDSSTNADDEQTSVTDSPEINPLQQTQSNTSNLPVETPPLSTMLPPPMALFDPDDRNRRFVGTPDYLAPETINGSGQDEMSDWWSCGCIIFEFLFGYPPFHAETPELVFEKITTRKIDWPSHEDYLVSDEARNLMSRLMTLDPKERLGSNAAGKYKSGGEEIRAHPWFDSINWDTLLEDEAQFVPAPENPEDTEYFDTRGATLQTFAEEVEDQKSSPGITPGGGPDYERPHDALTRSRSSMHSVGLKRNLMPLHIPPHVRDSRSRRLSEPVPPDDFGSFNYKNLPILEKANKDVINKLRQEALQAQAKSNAAAVGSASPAPSIDTGSPLLPSALQRRLSAYKGSTRSVSPAALSSVVSPPSRPSQPTSPMLVQFSVGTHHERRKTSSSSSATSASWQTPSLIPEFPKLGTSVSGPPTNPSPMKTRPTSMLVGSPDKNLAALQRVPSGAGPQTGRHRSHTLGSQDGGEPTGSMPPPTSTYQHSKRRSQVFDVSPSSSDNEDPRQKALLRVQRRRQSSRRMSRFSLAEGPVFRPLDILVCEDHPVSRLVMDRLLEKLHCRTISVVTGPDALRVASSEVQFDIIMMEVKLPQLSGTDVAKMIRATKNVNQQTPILAVTGYLKELPQDHHFDSLIEKPPTLTKLREQLINLCHWKPAPPGWRPGRESPQFSAGSPPISSSLRQESHLHSLATAQMPLHVLQDDSPSSTSSGPFARLHLDSVRTGSVDDSISSTNMSMLDEMIDPNESIVVTKPSGGDGEKWHSGAGLGILDDNSYYPSDFTHPGLPHLLHFNSAPPRLGVTMPSPRKLRHEDPATRGRRGASGKDVLAGLSTSGADSGDDDDDADPSPRFPARSPPFTGAGTASTPALRKAATTSPPLPPMGPIRPNFPRKSKLGTQLLRTDTSGAVISASQEQLSKEAMLAKPPAQLTSSQSEPGPVLETVEEHPFPMLDADVEADSSGLLSPPEKFIPDAQLVGHTVKEVDIDTLSPPLAGRPLTPLTSGIAPSPLQEATSLAPSPAPESPNPTL